MSSRGYQTEAQRQQLAQRAKLIVKVIEARGVKAADWGGTSDPYTELRIKDTTATWKTKTIKKTLNPFWNEEFTIPISDPEKEVLNIRGSFGHRLPPLASRFCELALTRSLHPSVRLRCRLP
jgi:C2 domain